VTPVAAVTRLGAYEILSALGVGGMGEVYRTADTRLKRQVAIKVLPASATADPERLARFQRDSIVQNGELMLAPHRVSAGR
jgi:serine/threonine-protein kinase